MSLHPIIAVFVIESLGMFSPCQDHINPQALSCQVLTRPGCAFDGSFRNANCLHNAQLPTRMWCAHRGLGCDDPRGCGGAWSGLAAGAGTVFARRLLQYVTPCTYGSRRIGSSKALSLTSWIVVGAAAVSVRDSGLRYCDGHFKLQRGSSPTEFVSMQPKKARAGSRIVIESNVATIWCRRRVHEAVRYDEVDDDEATPMFRASLQHARVVPESGWVALGGSSADDPKPLPGGVGSLAVRRGGRCEDGECAGASSNMW